MKPGVFVLQIITGIERVSNAVSFVKSYSNVYIQSLLNGCWHSGITTCYRFLFTIFLYRRLWKISTVLKLPCQPKPSDAFRRVNYQAVATTGLRHKVRCVRVE
jgi:hypothetical protein